MSININVTKKRKSSSKSVSEVLSKSLFCRRKRELDPILVCRLVGNYNYEGKDLKVNDYLLKYKWLKNKNIFVEICRELW